MKKGIKQFFFLPFTLHNNAAVYRVSGATESSFRILVGNTTIVARVCNGSVQWDVVILLLLLSATRAPVALVVVLLLLVVLMRTSSDLRARLQREHVLLDARA